MAFQIDIKDADQFKREILETTSTLQVLEAYSDWCGPSKAINATLKRLYFEHGDKGLKFYTAQSGILDVTKPHEGKCEPAFFFFKNGHELSDCKIVGINAPQLTNTVLEKLPQAAAA